MEKICTRCSFRTPATRAVCQVCGYSKFSAVSDVQVAVAKQPAVVMTIEPTAQGQFLIDLFRQTKKSVVTAVENFAKAVKESAETTKEKDSATEVANDTPSTEITFQEGEDLDTLIAWFKSYGVDRPLILQQKTEQPTKKAA
jgi:hypothetical protein